MPHGIRNVLALHAHRAAGAILCAALAGLVKSVCGVYHHGRHGGICLHLYAGKAAAEGTCVFQCATLALFQQEVVVKSAGDFYLLILTHGSKRHVLLIAEVHDSALHKAHFPCGKLPLGLRVKEIRVYPQQLMGVTAAVAAKVEICVVGKIQGCILVALGAKIHRKNAIIRELIPHGYLYIAREALIPIRRYKAEFYALLVRHKVPYPLIEAIPAPVKGKQLMAPVQLIFHAAKLCPGANQPVCKPAAHRAKSAIVGLILSAAVKAQHHVLHAALPIRHNNRYNRCSIVRKARLSVCALYGYKLSLSAVIVAAKWFHCYLHTHPPCSCFSASSISWAARLMYSFRGSSSVPAMTILQRFMGISTFFALLAATE